MTVVCHYLLRGGTKEFPKVQAESFLELKITGVTKAGAVECRSCKGKQGRERWSSLQSIRYSMSVSQLFTAYLDDRQPKKMTGDTRQMFESVFWGIEEKITSLTP
jgi:hypothetical protein